MIQKPHSSSGQEFLTTFKTLKILIPALLLFLILISSASAAVPGVKVTVIDQVPYPAQPGQQFRLWVQAENVGSGTINNITLQVKADYPFSISSGNSSKTYSDLYAGTKVYNEFFLYVDENATKGPHNLSLRYQVDGSNWIVTNFTVYVGGIVNMDNQGTLIISNVTSSPEAFMPGDEGIIWVTLKNNATPQQTGNKTNLTNARIQSVDLYSSDALVVTSPALYDLGIIAAGDTIPLPFKISIPEGTKDGTYLLTLNVTGSSYEYNIKRNIEIKVDSTGIKAIPSKEPKMNGTDIVVEIDIVNYHQGLIRGVTVVPEVEGVEFYPAEYFIGEMKPNDLYTAKFTIKQDKTMGETATIKSVYYNGDNLHEDEADIKVNATAPPSTPSWLKYGAILLVLMVIVLIGAHFYLKKTKDIGLTDYLKEQKNARFPKKKEN
ncbi:COG1361 S-layer family protein [Methanolapillus ohkumae]|uniref:S-layer protein n=1 Tax=Methanolapillus ohkumae TaxID=3028298 RepID=A0AA96V868_9EURY|nr:hypothetical protein MsAm2_12000 [Methanosarcinaceae archaeon Am2]